MTTHPTETPTAPGIQPLSNVLVLDVTPQEMTTPGGLVLPVAVQPSDTRMEATIVACGPQCERHELSPGRRVFIGKYLSNEILRGERKFRLALETEVLALLG